VFAELSLASVHNMLHMMVRDIERRVEALNSLVEDPSKARRPTQRVGADFRAGLITAARGRHLLAPRKITAHRITLRWIKMLGRDPKGDFPQKQKLRAIGLPYCDGSMLILEQRESISMSRENLCLCHGPSSS
jgi:hypothetical protein